VPALVQLEHDVAPLADEYVPVPQAVMAPLLE